MVINIKKQSKFKRFTILLVLFIIIISPIQVLAIDAEFYSDNNIIFYNPDGESVDCNSTEANIGITTGDNKISYNLPATSGKTGIEEAVADSGGLVGHEGDKITFWRLAATLPQDYRDYYIAMRWTWTNWNWNGTNTGLDNDQLSWMQKKPRIILVTNPKTGKSIYAAALESGPGPWVGVDRSRNNNPKQGWVNPQKGTPNTYTGIVSGLPPKAIDALGGREIAGYGGKGDVLNYQWATDQSVTPGPTDQVASGGKKSQSTTKIDGSDVTIIGDSITVGSNDKIIEKLPQVDIDAKESRPFEKGLEIAKSKSLRGTVVFALGTNSSLTSNDIKELVKTVGDDRTIVLLTNYTSKENNKRYIGNNNVIKKAANDNKKIIVADWATAAGSDPEKYITGDNIHPTAAGQKLFADTIYDALTQKEVNDNNSNQTNCNDNDTKTIDGHVYPMESATKANTHIAYLSPQPCPNPDSINSCHGGRNVWSLDLGVKQTNQNQEYCTEKGLGESYCHATGGKVLAIADGKFYSYKYDYVIDSGTYKDCASIIYQVLDADGNPKEMYWLGHTKADHNRKTGDTFKAGDVIGEVGTPYCTGNGSTAHLHINQSDTADHYSVDQGNPNQGFYTLLNKLYEALPEK